LTGRSPRRFDGRTVQRRQLRKRRTAVLVAAALGLAAVTVRGRGRSVDDRVFAWANSKLHNPALDRFFRAITELGSLYASGAAAATLVVRGRRREGLDALGAAATMWFLGNRLKGAFRRARPWETENPLRLLIGKPRGASWPSSHPAVLLAFVTVAGRNLELPLGERRALTGLAGVVAASRVYLGVHYPADVVGGLLLGRAVADVWSAAISPRTTGAETAAPTPLG
jgi:membrane-associated phospholipid phosphatase